MLENLKFTLLSGIGLYERKKNQLFSFSIGFHALSVVFMALAALVYLLMTSYGISLTSIFNAYEYMSAGLSSRSILQLDTLENGIFILNLSLFASMIFQGNHERITVKSAFASVTPRTWKRYTLFLLIYAALVAALSLANFRQYDHPANSLGQLLNLFEHRPESIITQAIYFLMIKLPIVLGFMLLMDALSIPLNNKTLRKYALPFLLCLVLFYLTDHIFVAVSSFLNQFLMSVLRIPFRSSDIPLLLNFGLYFLLVAFSYRIYAAFLFYPILFEKNKGAVDPETEHVKNPIS